METFLGTNATALWYDALCALLVHGHKVPSRVSGTKELHPAMLELSSPRRRLVTAFGRPVNPAFALAEVVWILSGRNDVAWLKQFNSKIDNYSDDGSTFNAAYGYRLRHEFGFDQLSDVIEGLKSDPGSRQAVLNIWSPDKDRAFIVGEHPEIGTVVDKNSTKDRACNMLAHVMIRNGQLDWLQIVRSNDIMWGTPNNFMQWLHIMEWVAMSVGVELGTYYHLADSLHVYDYHWDEAREVRPFDLYHELHSQHFPMRVGWDVLEALQADAQTALDAPQTSVGDPGVLGHYWMGVLQIFRSWAAYRAGDDQLALLLAMACTDPVLGAAQLRYYWWFRWHKQPVEFQQQVMESARQYGVRVLDWITREPFKAKQPVE